MIGRGVRNGVKQVRERHPLLNLRVVKRHLRLALHARDDGVEGHVVHIQIAAQRELSACVYGIEVGLIEHGLHRGLAGAILGGLSGTFGRGRGRVGRLVGHIGVDQLR